MAVMALRPNCTNLVTQLSTIGRKILLYQEKSLLPVLSSSRSICGKAMRDPNVTKPPPFPYKEKNFALWRRMFDRTTDRFDENTKIIVVDGAIASGKSAFAKELADELDMLYMPEATMDMIYINPYGYDMRKLDEKLPKSVRSFDTRNFCLDPHHENVAFLQVMLYKLKFSVYIDALAHLLNTGQGVVLDKSCYSDYVYTEALAREGFISKSAKYIYYEILKHTLDELMKPHLAIYLDVPVEKVLQKIKERGHPHEQNSKALTPSFLAALEDSYKRQYLKDVSIHSELLIYDWSDGGDVEVVVEDIERLDIDSYTIYDEKMKDWRLEYLIDWNDARKKYTDYKEEIMALFNVPRLDCPELLASGEDWEKFSLVWNTAPGMEYAEGYNAKMGDKSIWTKVKSLNKFSYFS